MENSKSKLTPEEAFNNKKLFSNKIYARGLKVIEEISLSFDKLEILNDEDKRLFFSTVNYYYHDLGSVAFEIRQILIKIDDDSESVHELQNVITELNKIVLSIQEFLNWEPEKLATHLEDTIHVIGTQIENLMKVVERDSLHEQKQKVLDTQFDLVLSVNALKLFLRHSYLSFSELEELCHEAIEKTKNNLIRVQNGEELMEEECSYYSRYSIQYLRGNVDYMRKMKNTENFHNDDMVNGFESAEVFGTDYISDLLEAVSCDTTKQMLDAIENCHKNIASASVGVQEGFQSVAVNNIGKNENETLNQLLVHLFITGINGMNAVSQSIEDAIVKQ